jgi:hypothetical protein
MTAMLQHYEQIPWDKQSASQVRMAVRDVVEWSEDLRGEPLAQLDAQLLAQGLPTLSAMRSTTYRKAIEILARGKIRNEREWHVLNGLITNTADLTLTATERDQADRLVHEYRRKA